MIPRRSLLLTIFLPSATVAVGGRIYLFWSEGLGDPPTVIKREVSSTAKESKLQSGPRPLASTDVIISRNLFDPERGTTKTSKKKNSIPAFARNESGPCRDGELPAWHTRGQMIHGSISLVPYMLRSRGIRRFAVQLCRYA